MGQAMKKDAVMLSTEANHVIEGLLHTTAGRTNRSRSTCNASCTAPSRPSP